MATTIKDAASKLEKIAELTAPDFLSTLKYGTMAFAAGLTVQAIIQGRMDPVPQCMIVYLGIDSPYTESKSNVANKINSCATNIVAYNLGVLAANATYYFITK